MKLSNKISKTLNLSENVILMQYHKNKYDVINYKINFSNKFEKKVTNYKFVPSFSSQFFEKNVNLRKATTNKFDAVSDDCVICVICVIFSRLQKALFATSSIFKGINEVLNTLLLLQLVYGGAYSKRIASVPKRPYGTNA